ncbi:hypothetical protein [Amycolatopsis balhimycina]|nr:hypothetical protein [Amycolatopsis balhimycina]
MTVHTDDSPGFVFGVYLSAYVCPGAGTCAPGGTPGGPGAGGLCGR